MGVRQAVEVRARTPNELGYVLVTIDFGRNERGIDGFDPAAEIDGLDFALGHPSHARSEYAWNVLLAPNRRLVAGVVERSVLPSFSDVSQKRVRAAIVAIAEREACPPSGTIRPIGSSMPQSAHLATCKARRLTSRCCVDAADDKSAAIHTSPRTPPKDDAPVVQTALGMLVLPGCRLVKRNTRRKCEL